MTSFDPGIALGEALDHHLGGRIPQAMARYRAILAVDPAAIDPVHMLGVIAHHLRDEQSAIVLMARANQINPGAPEILSNLSTALMALSRWVEAEWCAARASMLRPDYADARSNYSNALYGLERHAEALGEAQIALCLTPDFPNALINFALANQALGDVRLPLKLLPRALRIDPANAKAHFNHGIALLRAGDMANGWEEYEWRNRGGADFIMPRQFSQPQWSGEDLTGKTILLHAEQGIGDTILSCRYAPLVAERGGRVLFELSGPVHRLLSTMPGKHELVRAGEPLPPFDFHCSLMSLPRIFGTTPETVPNPGSYLAAEPQLVEQWRHKLGPDGFKIGITWQGNPNSPSESGRSAPLASFAPLAAIPGVRLISLQKRHGLDQLQSLPDGMRVEILEDFDEGPDAFVDTAAVMACLDLVISVDTATGHLAGALGRPAWIALQAVPYWLWISGRQDSPWYPHTRLFQQSRIGDWSEPFQRMARTLSAMLDPSSAFKTALDLHLAGDREAASAIYRRILANVPDHPDSLHLLGVAAHQQGRNQAALPLISRAIRLRPKAASYHSNLGVTLFELGRHAEAANAYRAAIRCQPVFADAHANLANVLYRDGDLARAVKAALSAICIAPHLAAAYNNLGISRLESGDLDGSAYGHERAIRLNPGYFEAYQNRGFIELYRSGNALAAIARESEVMNEAFAEPLRAAWAAPAAARPIPRLGLLSGDLRAHPVGRLVLPAIEALAAKGVRMTHYSNCGAHDQISERFRAASAGWRQIHGLDDAEAQALMRSDGIDILIDLSGHSFLNRALLLARKPAPLQIAWAVGYPATTGFAAVDYLLADRHQLPDGVAPFYREKLIRLPDSYIAFAPPDDGGDIGPAPVLKSNAITFGSFNVLKKISPAAIEAWSRILQGAPRSRLVMKTLAFSCAQTKAEVMARFGKWGIGRKRIVLAGPTSPTEHRAMMAECDIALDSFPYAGGLTSLECLWQGLPVVTLPGDTICSRHSFGYLSTLGLGALIAKDQADYVERALEWAQDRDRLVAFRQSIRERMLSSVLCDAGRFADHFSSALDRVWEQYRQGRPATGFDVEE